MGRSKARRVHLVIDSHPINSNYVTQSSGPRRRVKTLLFEDRHGASTFMRTLNPHTLAIQLDGVRRESDSLRDKSTLSFWIKALNSGVRIMPGEAGTIAQRENLKRLGNNIPQFADAFGLVPNMENFKRFLQADARYHNARERIIMSNILEELPKGRVQAIYGNIHGTLAQKLKKVGVEASVETQKGPDIWELRVERKLMLGQKPTELEYKKALLSYVLPIDVGLNFTRGSGKDVPRKADRFYFAAQNAILDALSPADIDKVIAVGNTPSRYKSASVNSERMLAMALKCLGLPLPSIGRVPFRKAIVSFMNERDAYWKERNLALAKINAKRFRTKR